LRPANKSIAARQRPRSGLRRMMPASNASDREAMLTINVTATFCREPGVLKEAQARII
jgi:hypothetical protein